MTEYSNKIVAGSAFPKGIEVSTLGGGKIVLGEPTTENCDWQMIVVYRGKHCPLCTRYVSSIQPMWKKFVDLRVEIVAISGDSEAQATEQKAKFGELSFPIGYGLTKKQMIQLGVYVSVPRSAAETDHEFSEPALFIVNSEKQLHVVDLANNPFVRPDLESLRSGIAFVRNPENHYPIRGTAETCKVDAKC